MVLGLSSLKKKKQTDTIPNDLSSFWMPFTPQRSYKANPRSVKSAKGMYYTTDDGRQVLDACSGLWCVTLGHSHPKVVEAIQRQAADLDYVPNFQYSHNVAFETASRLCAELPGDLDHVFFSNSGSEAVDTALKIVLAYYRAIGKPEKTRFIGRRRNYNGVGFGGISVGGIPYTKDVFSAALLPNCSHIGETYNAQHQAYSKGQPEWGAHLADELEDVISMYGSNNVACVIIEPVVGSAGIIPPPKGYLERMRKICDEHDIMMIFDEVTTGWGRLGYSSAAERFGVMPDIMTCAKGINNGAVPLGATFVRKPIYDAFMNGPKEVIELMHGYTYSGHPLACAASLATLDVIKEEGLFERVQELEPIWADALHSLKGRRHVVDIRNIGLMGGVEIDLGDKRGEEDMSRTMEAFDKLFFEKDLAVKYTGPVFALSPSFIVSEQEIDRIVTTLGDMLETID